VDARPDLRQLVTALQCARAGCTCAKGKVVHCPAHQDENPSLSVTERGGTVLVNCHAGCSQDAVISVLRERRLWPAATDHLPQPVRQRHVKIAAIYPYRDETGTLLFQVVREEPKAFRQRRPDGQGGWIGNLDGVRRVLYRLPELRAASTDAIVYVVEGEKDAEALVALGLVATTNPGGAGKWQSEYGEALRRRPVVILPDNDEAGRAHALRVAQAVHDTAASVKIVELPGLPEKGDVSDYLTAGGARETLEALVAQASDWAPVPAPDVAVLLDDIVAFIRQYVVLTSEQADTLSLWVLQSWTLGAFETTPYCWVSSAEKQSGKTRLLEVLFHVVRHPWLTGRVTAAVLVRKIDAECPTLLLDETDAAFGFGDEYAAALRDVLNTGHRRGGKASVCVGQGAQMTYRDFSTFCPKALAGLKRLPDTVEDRSIPIRLRRRRRDEPVRRYRYRKAEGLAAQLREKLAAWAAAVTVAHLREAQPAIPGELDDRASEGWEPLLAIADLAGGTWPSRARRASLALSTGRAHEDESEGVRLLTDIRAVFERHDVERIATADLLVALKDDEESPWGTWGKAKVGLTPHDLARLLRPFEIRPTTVNLEDRRAKGYKREDFEDAWTRYLPKDPLPPLPSASGAAFSDVSDPLPTPQVTDAKVPQSPHLAREVTGVTDLTPYREGGHAYEPSRLAPVTPASTDVQEGEKADVDRFVNRAKELFDGEVVYDGPPRTGPWGVPLERGVGIAMMHKGYNLGFPAVPEIGVDAGMLAWRRSVLTSSDDQCRQALETLERLDPRN
jgi:hypothetical protein